MSQLSEFNNKSICIAGFGVMGASIAHSVRKNMPDWQIKVLIRKEHDVEEIASLKAVDKVSTLPAEVIPESGIVIICLPPWALESYITILNPYFTKGTIVTDITSVKADLIDKLSASVNPAADFISSHPMAGTEKTGFRNYVQDLLTDAPCILTPGENTNADAIVLLKQFWDALSMKVSVMSVKDHDLSVGLVSHLPHALADILMVMLNKEKQNLPWLYDITGGSFRDMTRIAKGSPKLWSQIFSLNKEILLAQLDQFSEEIKLFKQSVLGDKVEEYVLQAYSAKQESAKEDKNN